MTDEETLDKLESKLFIIIEQLASIADLISENIQTVKACAIAQIELPNGCDATQALKAINQNFEGA